MVTQAEARQVLITNESRMGRFGHVGAFIHEHPMISDIVVKPDVARFYVKKASDVNSYFPEQEKQSIIDRREALKAQLAEAGIPTKPNNDVSNAEMSLHERAELLGERLNREDCMELADPANLSRALEILQIPQQARIMENVAEMQTAAQESQARAARAPTTDESTAVRRHGGKDGGQGGYGV